MKKKLLMLLTLLLIVTCFPAPVNAAQKYSNGVEFAKTFGTKKSVKKAKKIERKLNKKYKKHKYVLMSEAAWDTLLERKGKHDYYITYEIGVVDNKKGDGHSLCLDSPYNYINYKGYKKGTKVLSYFVWCRCCNEPDDIIKRYDVKLK